MVALKKLSLVLIVLLVCAMLVTPARAQTKDPEKIKGDIDLAVTLNVNKIKNFQSSYLLTHGKFYQALWTHTNAPADGNPIGVDKLLSKPSYQNETLQTLFDDAKLDKLMSNRFKIDWYDGPSGKGYTLTLETIINDLTYQRIMHLSGNETYREQAWFEVKPITR